MANKSSPDKLSIVVYDHHFDKVHYALVMAAAAAAIGKPVTLFFTMGACQALLKIDADKPSAWQLMPLSDEPGTGAERDQFYRDRGIGGFEELLSACIALNVKCMICEMGLRAKNLDVQALREDLVFDIAGVVSFLHDASKHGSILTI